MTRHHKQTTAPSVFKGRGAPGNPQGRFETYRREEQDDGWTPPDAPEAPATELFIDSSRSIVTRNRSPDIPFEQSMNPYRGCEHGCVYCYARPSHSYLGLSPGLDFETKLFYKPDAAAQLEAALRRPSYRPKLLSLGSNTDVYQPIERRLQITRSLLQVLAAFRHPVALVTKSALVERDLDLLADLACDNLVRVFFSVPTLSDDIKRTLEPRTTAPSRRLKAMARLAQAAIPVGVMVAPVIPALTDHEMEQILASARDHGAESAGYVLLRLPHEVRELFTEWLRIHHPGRAEHVLSLLRQSHDGAEYRPTFGTRMRGSGHYAELLSKRFRLACRKLDLNGRDFSLNTTAFRVPPSAGEQLPLFDP